MEEDWRNPTFRQSMIRKLDEHMQQFQLGTMKSATEMESNIYTKATTREEYMNFLHRLFMYIKSNGKKPVNVMPGASNINPGLKGAGQNQQAMGQQVGPSGSLTANLLQSLNQRSGQQLNIQQAMHNKLSGVNMLQGQQMGMNQMNQMQNMQVNSLMGQLNQMNQRNQQQQMSGSQVGPNEMQQVQNQMQNTMGQQLSGTGMPSPMQHSMQSAMQSQQSPSQQQQQQQHQMNVSQISQQLGHVQRKPVDIMSSGYPGQRNLTPNQFLSQSPSPSVPSPGGLNTSGSNQMVPSPALVPSPGAPHAMLGGPRSMGMAPSPSSSLNTPAGIVGGAVPSPIQDDQMSQACKDKIQKLRKYIDPLNKMISKMTNEGYTERTYKMKKLLEILTNPSSTTTLDVLQKCEIALERMDFKKTEAASGPIIPSSLKEHQFLTPLLEVVSTILQTPCANHTLYKTFGNCVESFAGPEIKNMPPPLKRIRTEEAPSEIPDVLQGEIARLDQRFKVSLDPSKSASSKSIELVCCLEDKHLPCVPSISIIVPVEYPKIPPKCLISDEHRTPFLAEIQEALNARLDKLPRFYSVSQLLDTWEMSVRKACASKIQKLTVEKVATTSNASNNASSTVQPANNVSGSNSVSNGVPTSLITTAAS